MKRKKKKKKKTTRLFRNLFIDSMEMNALFGDLLICSC